MMMYSSKIDFSDGETDALICHDDLFSDFNPSDFGQLFGVARLRIWHLKTTSETIGNGIDNMLNGSKFRLV